MNQLFDSKLITLQKRKQAFIVSRLFLKGFPMLNVKYKVMLYMSGTILIVRNSLIPPPIGLNKRYISHFNCPKSAHFAIFKLAKVRDKLSPVKYYFQFESRASIFLGSIKICSKKSSLKV